MSELKIGLIGLDTSHVTAFAGILNDTSNPNHIQGAKIVCGYPGGSDDLEVSYSRVAKFTEELSSKYGVKILDTPQAVAEACDLVFISAVDGRAHRGLFEKIAKFGKPVFIDKPFACSVEDAKAMLDLAHSQAIPVMSCSSLRYAENLQAELLRNSDELGKIIGCDIYGPMNIQLPLPPLFWYGIHCVEMAVATLGCGCKTVQVTQNAGNEVITCTWNDGRMALIHGLRNAHGKFGITVQREKSADYVNVSDIKRPWYATMLDAILGSLPEGRSDVPGEQMLEITKILVAGNESRKDGKIITL